MRWIYKGNDIFKSLVYANEITVFCRTLPSSQFVFHTPACIVQLH